MNTNNKLLIDKELLRSQSAKELLSAYHSYQKELYTESMINFMAVILKTARFIYAFGSKIYKNLNGEN